MQQTPARTQMTTYEVASGLARWAMGRSLLQQLTPEIENQFLAAHAFVPMSSDAEQILRQKEIHSIAYNQVARIVYIYTKRKVAQKDHAVLPTYVNGSAIAYPHGQIDPIGKEACAPQGAVLTIRSVPNVGNFYACGSSISPGNDASAGTLGALLRDQNGLLLGLTNNHVTALCSHVPVGMPILAPGVFDVGPGGLSPFTIGFHQAALEMNHGSVGNIDITRNTDAAVFAIPNEALVTSYQGDAYDTPTQVQAPQEGMTVQKVGRTTGHTVGRIVGRELRPVAVTYHANGYGFSSSMLFANVYIVHGIDAPFSAAGDSGSLVVANGENGQPESAVGLVFAGGSDHLAPGGAKSMILPLAPMLEALNAQLVGGHNV